MLAIFMFIFTMMSVVLSIYCTWVDMQNIPHTLLQQAAIIPMISFKTAGIVSSAIAFLLGDLVILWRTCVVWYGNRVVLRISIALYFMTFGEVCQLGLVHVTSYAAFSFLDRRARQEHYYLI
jgi:hypothetical protein